MIQNIRNGKSAKTEYRREYCRNNKRSQIEMFGLALIVILIIIGFFIFVSFKQKNPLPDYKKSYIVDETASNFVNSIVNVNPVECTDSDYTVSDMLKFCARGDNVKCSGFDACTIANRTMWNITQGSLVKQGMSFTLYTKGAVWEGNAAESEIVIRNKNCTGRERGQTGTIPISLYPVPGHVYLNLEICN